MKRVVVIGSGLVDILLKSSGFKMVKSHNVEGGLALCEVYGGKLEAEEMMLLTGGSATNVAVGLRRLGLSSLCVSRIGEDLLSEIVEGKLKEEGVETSLVQKDKLGQTGVSALLVAKDGGRSIVTFRGVSKQIQTGEIDWDKVGGADWVQVGSLGGNMSLFEDILAMAEKKNLLVGANPGKNELEQKERLMGVLPKLELLSLNKMEAATFLGRKFEDEEEEMARKFLELGVKRVAISFGNKGALLADGQRLIRSEAYKVKSVDDTGAGDAFVGGLVAGLIEEKTLEVSLKMGLANGASVVKRLGSKAGLLRQKEMDKWLTKNLRVVEMRMES